MEWPFPFPVNPLCLVHIRCYFYTHPRPQGTLVAMTVHAKMRNGSSPMAGISAILFDQQLPGLRLNPVRMDFATLISTPPHFLVVRVAVLQEFPELLPVVVPHGTVAESCAALPVPDEAEDVPASLVSHFPLTIRHIQEVEYIGVAVQMVFPYDPVCGFVVCRVLFLRMAVRQIGIVPAEFLIQRKCDFFA